MSRRLFKTKFTAAEVLVAATVLSVALLLVPSMASAAELVSVNNLGTHSGDGQSFPPAISADGRFVVFASDASNLSNLVKDDNGTTDIFVRNLETGTTTLVSVNSVGAASGNGRSGSPTISADGRVVAFVSNASDLAATDTNGNANVFVRDLQAGITTLVSVNSVGAASGNRRSDSPVISADGRFVAFVSNASDLAATDTNGNADVFVRDLVTGMTKLVSVNSAGTSGDNLSLSPVISADGQFVAFVSFANNLAATEDTNETFDVFVRDLQTGTTTLLSVNSAGTSGDKLSLSPVISADGRFVAFVSFASNLVSPKTNGKAHIFVRDLQEGTTTLVSINISGTSGNGFSGEPVISPDGGFVAFQSSANDLVSKDTNGDRDVFVRDLQEGTTTLVSVNSAGRSDSPVISADGQSVAFRSFATNLAATDTSRATDVFVRDLQNETTTLVSVNSAGNGSGDGSSEAPVISADGKVVAFRSFASNLVGTDDNGAPDVFVSVLGQEEPALALIIDEDSIDNGAAPNFFSDVDVNDHIAQIGLRTQLPFFAAHVGDKITLHTGEIGDEGWFALKTIPASWEKAGPINDDGLRNFIGNPSQPFPYKVGPGMGTGDDPEALLDKIPDVTPLRATGLKMLEGRKVCAVVYDIDISMNYDPLNGSLRGATLGTVAFEVVEVKKLEGFSSSSLPEVEIEILNAEEVCEGELTLFTDAPKPISSS